LLFLAAGSGITPLMSMTRALVARGMPVALTLLYWARRRDELCFVEELRELAREHAGFKLRFFLTGDAASSNDEGEGRIDAAQLASHVPDLASRRVFACGPNDFVEAARSLAAPHARGFDSEAFTAPRIADDSDTTGKRAGHAGGAAQRVLTVPRGASAAGGAGSGRRVARASGCRMGICNTCACGKRIGQHPPPAHRRAGTRTGDRAAPVREPRQPAT
jgi:ferredoxin-NADP reductase